MESSIQTEIELMTIFNNNNNEFFKNEINLINKLYKDYYCKEESNDKEDLKDLLKFILIQSINKINNKINIKNSSKLLFKSNNNNNTQHQISCNQLLDSYDFNVASYLDNLKKKYSNKIQINITNKQEELTYEIEQYRTFDKGENLYLDKQINLTSSFIFNDYNSDYDYKFHLTIYKPLENHPSISYKLSNFRLDHNQIFHKYNVSLSDEQDNKDERISLNAFKLNNFLDLINDFKISDIVKLISLIMEIIDNNIIDLNKIYHDASSVKNELVLHINNILINNNDEGYNYLNIVIHKHSNQTNMLKTNKNETIHLKNFDFETLMKNPNQVFLLSIMVYNYIINKGSCSDVKLITKFEFKLNILEYFDNYLSIIHDNLSFRIQFSLSSNMKINTNMLAIDEKSIFDVSIIDNCIKQFKNENDFIELNGFNLNLKKVLNLVLILLDTTNQPKKNHLSEQLFKLIVIILTKSVPNLKEISANFSRFASDNNLAISKFLIQHLKNQFDLYDSNEIEFTNTLRTFQLIIELIVKLAINQPGSENFMLNLKYDLNFIFMKISKKTFKNKFFIYSFLNFEFMSVIATNNIYSINEIYEIIYFKLFNDLSSVKPSSQNDEDLETDKDEFQSYLKLIEEIVLEKFLNSESFNNCLISLNYEFRGKFIKFIINSFLMKNNLKIDSAKLKIIIYLMQKMNYKFDKKEFKHLIVSLLKTFELNYKLNLNDDNLLRLESIELKVDGCNGNDLKLFLCLIDLINLSISSFNLHSTSIQQLNNYFDHLKLVDFIYLFQLFNHFMNFKELINLKNIWQHTNKLMKQFLTTIFKYILRSIYKTTIETAFEQEANEIEILLISYFKIEFSLGQNNIINDLNQINCLSKYKYLNEFLIQNSIKYLLNNEFNNDEFIKLTNYICSNNMFSSTTSKSKSRYLLEIFLIYEIL